MWREHNPDLHHVSADCLRELRVALPGVSLV
jgi:hypothetical protein